MKVAPIALAVIFAVDVMAVRVFIANKSAAERRTYVVIAMSVKRFSGTKPCMDIQQMAVDEITCGGIPGTTG